MNAKGDMVIVEIEYREKIGNSRFILPDAMGIKENTGDFVGKIISVGPECKLDVKVGDTITFRRNEGHKLIAKDKNYRALKSKWVGAKITRDT